MNNLVLNKDDPWEFIKLRGNRKDIIDMVYETICGKWPDVAKLLIVAVMTKEEWGLPGIAFQGRLSRLENLDGSPYKLVNRGISYDNLTNKDYINNDLVRILAAIFRGAFHDTRLAEPFNKLLQEEHHEA